MIEVYAADLSSFYGSSAYQKAYQSLPGWRKEMADRIKTEHGKAECVGAWTLWEMVRREKGNLPEVASEEEFLALSYVNLSHSKSLAMVAVDPEKEACVGCDVEKISELRMKLAKRFFTPEEYEHVLCQEAKEEKISLFYRYWVLKESFIKVTREGMSRPLNSFSALWEDGKAKEVILLQKEYNLERASECDPECHKKKLNRDAQENQEKRYYYQEYEINEACADGSTYKAAVCADTSKISEEIIYLSL